MGYKNVSVLIGLLVVFVSPMVFADDTTPIPEAKPEVETWFKTHVAPLPGRTGLDPALAAAEAAPIKAITVGPSGEFKTINEAIKSVPAGNTKRVIIKIAPGDYKEKVTIDRNKPFITLMGEPTAMPVITFDGTAAKYGTVDSASLIILSDYFMAVNIVVKNTAPAPDGKTAGAQALSMRISGNFGAFYNCKFYGFQDTICDDTGNHFFKDCYVEGTFDFIFGSGTSIYLGTQLHVVGDGIRVITAHAGKSVEEKTGYAFVHCKVTGTGGGIYLGRAWMSHPKVVYAYTEMTSVVNPTGWQENKDPAHDKTVFYGEYKCSGPGSAMEKRVPFTQQIDAATANKFLSLGYIQGSKWLLPPPSADSIKAGAATAGPGAAAAGPAAAGPGAAAAGPGAAAAGPGASGAAAAGPGASGAAAAGPGAAARPGASGAAAAGPGAAAAGPGASGAAATKPAL